MKLRRALNKAKKEVRFIGDNTKEGVVLTPAKASSRGHAIKPRKIFKQGEN
jgi:hypothetical protein